MIRPETENGSRFEGWYFKHQRGKNTLSLIPGVNFDRSGGGTAFLQVIANDFSRFIAYPVSQFSARGDPLKLRLGASLFTERGVHLSVGEPGFSMFGTIRYGRTAPLKYDVMGPLRFFPFLECRHGVVSRRHRLFGRVVVNGSCVDFDGGTGYIETDRGTSFPKNYLWTQCNTFAGRDTCIMAAVADVPIAGISFRGCLCSVYDGGKEYRLATYLGARVESCRRSGVILRQGRHLFKAELLGGAPNSLLAPESGGMTRTIHEHAACSMRYRFYEDGRLRFDLQSDSASFEFAAESEGGAPSPERLRAHQDVP